MHKSKHKVKFRRIKRGGKMAKKHKTQKKVIPRVNFFRRNRVNFQTKKSLAQLKLQNLLKKLAQRKLVGMQYSTTKHLPFLSQILMEKLAHRNLPFLSQKLMEKLAQRKLVGMTVLGEKVILVCKRSRPNAKRLPSLSQIFMEKLEQRNLVGMTVSGEKVILVSKCPRPTKKRSPFLRQNFKEKLAHRNLPFLSQKLMKKLAQRKLVGMTVLDYRILAVSKRPKLAGRRNKTLAHKPNLLSSLKLRIRVALRQGSVIKKFKQHIKWYTIPPPGGGGILYNKAKLRYRKGGIYFRPYFTG